MSAVLSYTVPAVDMAVAARFLDMLAEGEPVTFQTFDDDAVRKHPKLARIAHGELDGCFAQLSKLNAAGAGIFWMVNSGDGAGRAIGNVTSVRALFLDLDGAPLAPVLAAGVDPHAVIESSPGKWHVYWMVAGCTLMQFKPAQQALAAKFGGDTTVCDLPRVLRVPGFLHRKGEPFQTRIVSMEPTQPYQFDDLAQRLGLDLSTPALAPAAPRVDAATGEIIGKVTHPGRHEHLRRKLADLNWRGIPEAGIRAALHQTNERDCEPPKTAAEVNGLVDDFLRRYATQHGKDLQEQQRTEEAAVQPADAEDHHRNAPRPDPACLYGLIGDIARTASATTEASAYATALNALAYLGCCLGRGPYLPVGNTYHHARLFGMHVGRSGRGRKGDAVSLLHRVDMALREAHPDLAPQVHRGGLSSREGLAYLMHDGFKEGKNEVEPIHDKRLWIIESEFANVLHQTKRDGNTLSAALRDCWDGVGIKPATKSNRISASFPHVSMSAAVTTTELLSLIEQRELSNGFANRFLMIFSERTRLEPFPKSTPKADVDALAGRVAEVLKFAQADRWTDRDHLRVSLSPEAAEVYGRLYLGELNRYDYGPLVTGLLERRAPTLLRIAMIFAVADQVQIIELKHLEAALAWIRYWTDSVRFIFSSAAQEQVQHEVADSAKKIVEYLVANGRQPRTKINVECFHGKLSRDKLDAALDELLHASPPAIIVEVEPRKDGPGSPTKFYVLAAKSAKSAKCEDSRGLAAHSVAGEVSEISEVSADEDTSFRSVRSVRQQPNSAESPANAHVPLSSLISPANADTEAF